MIDSLLAAACAMLTVAGTMAFGCPPAWALLLGLIVFVFLLLGYRTEAE